MDEFTKRHLSEWCNDHCYIEDYDDFYKFACDAVESDPEYDWNWSNLYRRYRYSLT